MKGVQVVHKYTARIDERYCGQIGSEDQHKFLCRLASLLGYSQLRDFVVDALGMKATSVFNHDFTIRQAQSMIDYARAELNKERGEVS